MNTKTLISALALTLALGSLALPGTAAARDYDRGGDRQEQHRDHRDRDDHRRHDNNRGRHERDRYEHRRHDRGHHYGHNHWIPFFPNVRYGYFDFGHHRDGHYNPERIIRIQPRW